ncbi:hypothetical protein SISSUDRAFT_997393 [Sistotremastrum suecicum HHB10207 ss-3]|uniref:Dynamitin-domain-containing protein n=1 Tax=Sistotremastrum suecicum HHB10207 ss-3 TaxID=1314776 RepID=A0A166IE96_9AGAM|nr:hypothetical protein SISSUDRAFT_997393 [Sistotremastrum suecicum HHB10207 ss-3]
MSAAKYANLPDIDTAPDLYETPDVFPGASQGSESEDEEGRATRSKVPEVTLRDGLDGSHVMKSAEATERFRRAEQSSRKKGTSLYAYTPSTSYSAAPPPFSQRLHSLKHELAALEAEAQSSLTSSPQDEEPNSAELVRELADMRTRLERVGTSADARKKTPNGATSKASHTESLRAQTVSVDDTGHERKVKDVQAVSDIDKRLGELEKILGSSALTLDEASPLSPPLLPMYTRLNTLLGLLTQPRHLDSISRRLKLLLPDLDRLSNAQTTPSKQGARRQSGPQSLDAVDSSQKAASSSQPSSMQETILPILNRLAPHLNQIPHILARLRTLSALHASASAFDETLSSLEADQQSVRRSLTDLSQAVAGIEGSMESNNKVVQGNFDSLDMRITALTSQMADGSNLNVPREFSQQSIAS